MSAGLDSYAIEQQSKVNILHALQCLRSTFQQTRRTMGLATAMHFRLCTENDFVAQMCFARDKLSFYLLLLMLR